MATPEKGKGTPEKGKAGRKDLSLEMRIKLLDQLKEMPPGMSKTQIAT